MHSSKVRVGIVGCGNISKVYARQIGCYPQVEIGGFQDVAAERATAMAQEFGGKAYGSLAEMLADPSIDLIVNLTIQRVHAEVARQCIAAGKSVYTEKPLALSYKEARELVDLADAAGVRISSAPITYMGEAQETAWRLIREGKTGAMRVVYAEINHGRIEDWHPNPESFYDVGILWDVGVYQITLLTAFFGPIKRVTGMRRFLKRERTTMEGRSFQLAVPDFGMALLDFESGVVARFTASFYVKDSKQGGSLEFHGDTGRVYLEDFQDFGANVEYGAYGQPYVPVPLDRPRERAAIFSRGIDEMTQAMLENRPHRATGNHAVHVIEVLEAIDRSEGKPIEITSKFVPPAPIDLTKVAVAVKGW